ncbi:MAG: long-chain fatty acid--CoA ligase [Oscillatoriales cyanobacterium SM2_2_1]|nr:long-chain fatty acid--CoA ligase [Oscillatoriales cyanobacterium SM2_2_1]
MSIIRDHATATSLWQVWQTVVEACPDMIALHDPHATPPVNLTYRDTITQMTQFGAGLRALGLQVGDKVALIADNSPRWLIADQGILAIGAANATRSSQAERQELLYILEHSESVALVVENLSTLQKLQPELDHLPVRVVVLLSDEEPPTGVQNFQQLLAIGKDRDLGRPQITRETLATLIYTSGTGGKPKGVMLTHGNLLYQVQAARTVLQLGMGDRVLSILPTWHSYERSFEYFIFSLGCTQIYTNLRSIKKDLKDHAPHYMVAVPRLWESIYEGIQKQFREQPVGKQKLVAVLIRNSEDYIRARRIWQGLDLLNLSPSAGQRFRAGLTMLWRWPLHRLGDLLVYKKVRAAMGGQMRYVVSGGGSIAEHLEDFYELANIPILGGYGLTETSPITHVRRPHRNIRNADGQPLPRTETRIVDPETRQEVPVGKQGLVLIRGPQVMKGYYNNPEATSKVIDSQGWFDSGDLGYVTPWQDLVIVGRAKDTIVLSNGENIEPQPIEDACLRSPFIDQVVLVGQDQKQLGALIYPNLGALEAAGHLPPEATPALLAQALATEAVRSLFREELNREVKNRPGYSVNDRIGGFEFLLEPLNIADGTMTQTFKIRRNAVFQKHGDLIAKIYLE